MHMLGEHHHCRTGLLDSPEESLKTRLGLYRFLIDTRDTKREGNRPRFETETAKSNLTKMGGFQRGTKTKSIMRLTHVTDQNSEDTHEEAGDDNECSQRINFSALPSINSWHLLIFLLTLPAAITSEANNWERPLNMPRIQGLEVMCGAQHMEVHLTFDLPFQGLVASKGMYGHPNCIYVPPRSSKTSFVFNINYEQCGTKPDNNGKFYENTIVVQYDEELIEAWDEAKRLRCEWFNDYEKTATKTSPMVISDLDIVELNFHGDNVDCWMEIQEGKGPWAPPLSGIVPLGSPLTMVIAVKDPTGEFDMRVKACEASDGHNGHILPLSDPDGCILRPKLIGKFSKIKLDDGRATVLTYAFLSAFKFPDMLNVHMRCTVEICRHGCPDHCTPHELPSGSKPVGQKVDAPTNHIQEQVVSESIQSVVKANEVPQATPKSYTVSDNVNTLKPEQPPKQPSETPVPVNVVDNIREHVKPQEKPSPQPEHQHVPQFQPPQQPENQQHVPQYQPQQPPENQHAPQFQPPQHPEHQQNLPQFPQLQQQQPENQHVPQFPPPKQPDNQHPTQFQPPPPPPSFPQNGPAHLPPHMYHPVRNGPPPPPGRPLQFFPHGQQRFPAHSNRYPPPPGPFSGRHPMRNVPHPGPIPPPGFHNGPHLMHGHPPPPPNQRIHHRVDTKETLPEDIALPRLGEAADDNSEEYSRGLGDNSKLTSGHKDDSVKPQAEQLKGEPSTTSDPFELPVEVPVFPKGPRKLRFRRSISSNNGIIGIEGAFKVISEADLNFALNGSTNGHSQTAVLKGAPMLRSKDTIYGICLPRLGFGIVFFGLGLATLVAILTAVFLAYAHYVIKVSNRKSREGCPPNVHAFTRHENVLPMVILRKMCI
ncbi:unnamed protein product [Allacma fusca]|uniref:ZP domain-containing protein n=1 Tax=Allacma fusca TaxID=39272 RepID=A0A8J2NPH5_9HEXA|nr:unnamed protein product [Allacma fusca]